MEYDRISTIGLCLLALKTLTSSPKVSKHDKRESEFLDQGMISNMSNARLDNFISEDYGVIFKYPASWNKNPRYDNKYEGIGGFFEVAGFEGNSNNIDSAIQEQINEAYKPYGSNPMVRKLTIDGQPAREIIPSEDQGTLIKDREAALVVQYKNPMIINGVPYQYIIIWTNRENLPLIIKTFKFMQHENLNS
ncbi:hypothetical protein [Cellulosilyticum ruminicola]|uniref:hypothetical protein n=1 Tax=Cellulosilyticum ruminicola TaxID=425254 RepID=UPI0006D103BF|nr:hypothetical protein [Cellulosilyticum ruminicola]